MIRRWKASTSVALTAAIWAVVVPLVALSLDAPQGGAQTGQTSVPPPVPPPVPVVVPARGSGDPVFIRFVSRSSPTRRMGDEVMAVPADNPITDAKIALGRRLFFDPLLSADRTVSCATCHNPDRGFADDRQLAVGVFGRVGQRHSPALVNRGYGRTHFWDGRAASLEAQVLLPVVDPNEMALTLDEMMTRLRAEESYRREFQIAFAREMTQEDVQRALATFLRTIKSTDTPYDQFRDGRADALSAAAQEGLTIFRSKGFCVICHVEPMFTDETFHNTGVAWRPDTATFADDGRFAVTGRPPDRGRFKTPTLREIARTAPYMHDGSLKTLADVVDFYDRGGRPNPNLFPVIRPLGLTAAEKASLVAFLESLSSVPAAK